MPDPVPDGGDALRQLMARLEELVYAAPSDRMSYIWHEQTTQTVRLLKDALSTSAAPGEGALPAVEYPCGCRREYCPTHKPAYLPEAAAPLQGREPLVKCDDPDCHTTTGAAGWTATGSSSMASEAGRLSPQEAPGAAGGAEDVSQQTDKPAYDAVLELARADLVTKRSELRRLAREVDVLESAVLALTAQVGLECKDTAR